VLWLAGLHFEIAEDNRTIVHGVNVCLQVPTPPIFTTKNQALDFTQSVLEQHFRETDISITLSAVQVSALLD
jgi:hypothetical protein